MYTKKFKSPADEVEEIEIDTDVNYNIKLSSKKVYLSIGITNTIGN